ncbi:MAG: hypothetical protein KGJ60_14595 [Verrucomicrobiota bacterium]|nr:hypothetical protein [Verrucomicrobiota bacterium]
MPRWTSCNVLHAAPGASRLWQFDAKGGGYTLGREHGGERPPAGWVAKSWSALWKPRLNVAWLPPETVFFRVIELPPGPFDETLAMVELQLEKLSPMPVAQVVWTIHILPRRADASKPHQAGSDGPGQGEMPAESLQTVVVVIAARAAVEEFLGKLEERGYLADRLEAPFLDQLQAESPAAPANSPGGNDSEAWIYPGAPGGPDAALVAWRSGGVLRNLSVLLLPAAGDRAKGLKDQLAQQLWAGELEGWLPAPPQWHLVAGGAAAGEWEPLLRQALDQPARLSAPLPPAELAALTARRAAAANPRANLLPAEFSTRYHQQFVDRLWLRGLLATGALYAIGVAIYLGATQVLAYRTHQVEGQVAALSGSYTNALQLQARYNVLKEREALKYAALDCWKVVAESLPSGLTLQRFSFDDGQRLVLSGTVPSDQISQITDHFFDAVRKAQVNGRPMFSSSDNDVPSYRQVRGEVSWNFALALSRSEEGAP